MIDIVIPSHGRAGRVLTTDRFPAGSTVVCVAESQIDQYREADPDQEYSVHPDSVVGMSQKRTWIMKEFGDCFMIDDDCDKIVRNDAAPKEDARITPDEALGSVEQAYGAAKQLGICLFGFETALNPLHYNVGKPFRLTGIVGGGTFGVISSNGAKFGFGPSDCPLEDMWASFENAYHHRICLVDKRRGFVFKDTGSNEGGMATMRTARAFERGVAMLRDAFGDVVSAHDQEGGSVYIDFHPLPW